MNGVDLSVTNECIASWTKFHQQLGNDKEHIAP